MGQKGTLTRRWAPCGSRPRAIRDHRFKSAYLFGAVCPDRDLGIAVVLSRASSEAMDIMLAELSQAVAPGAHAAVLIDGAGYHIAGDLTVPDNITLVRLPSYSPELNAIEKLWQFMRENILSHRLVRWGLQVGLSYPVCGGGAGSLCTALASKPDEEIWPRSPYTADQTGRYLGADHPDPAYKVDEQQTLASTFCKQLRVHGNGHYRLAWH